ncbi:MAG: hypothetical protein ACE15D_11820 [Candidatus Eisenbacteria bacterium]|nr:hypothetical protein [Candidatus Eisenbacteria bacterium]
MKLNRLAALVPLLGLALPLSTGLAQDSVIYLDFDDDGDPYTIRTTLPLGETVGTARFVLEVGSEPIGGVHIWATITEGCVNDPNMDAHYGARADFDSFEIDPVYAQNMQISIPTCTYCCPWIFEADIVGDPPVVPGSRYFIAQGTWHADCEDPYDPPAEFDYEWVQGVSGEGTMVLGCPPVAATPTTWGRIRTLYRD